MNPLLNFSGARQRAAMLVLGIAAPALAGVSSVPVSAQQSASGIAPVNVAASGARPSDVAMPLASVGSSIGWKIGSEDYRVNVPVGAASRVTKLEVYSPEINLNDYANKTNRSSYYGDELYGKNAQLSTTFSLRDPSGTSYFSRTFGSAKQHSFEQLWNGTLQPGVYALGVSSLGNGKNAFQVRASSGVRVEASQFVVNARGQFGKDQLVAFFQVGKDALGKTVKLENYDADGPQELALTLVGPDGKRTPLTASPDTKWASNPVKVAQNLIGTWKVLARVLPTTRQFSNAFAFRLRLDEKNLFAQIPGFQSPAGKPLEPLQVVVQDANGQPVPGASFIVTGSPTRVAKPVLPDGWRIVRAELLDGQGKVESDSRVSVTSSAGSIRFIARRIVGTLQVSAFAVACGVRTPVDAQFTVAPAGMSDQTAQTGSGVSLAPGEYTVQPATPAGSSSAPAKVTIRDEETSVVSLEYAVQPAIEFEPGALTLQVGQETTLTATVSSAFPTALPVSAHLILPDGLEATGPASTEGQVMSGQPFVLRVPVRALAPISAGTIRAVLGQDCATVIASATITTPAELSLKKTADRDTARPGDAISYIINVTNTGGSRATGVKLTDALPEGLEGQNLSETFDLEPGATETFTVDTTVAGDASQMLVNTANLSWMDQQLESSASVEVKPPAAIPLKLEKTVDRPSARPDERVEYTVTATNTGDSPMTGIELSDKLPDGLSGVSLSETFDLEPGAHRSFSVIAYIEDEAPERIENTARAVWQGQEITASASLSIAPEPAKLRLEKSVDRPSARPGETVNFTVTIENWGGSLARDVSVTDALPAGLIGAKLTETFDLEPGQKRSFSVPATVASDQGSVTLENIASVEWEGQRFDARATLEVSPPQMGTLRVNAVAVVCGTRTPIQAGFTVLNAGAELQTAQTGVNLALAPGTYAVQPNALDGASATPVTVTVTDGNASVVTLEYAVRSEIALEPRASSLKVGETVALKASVTTAFQQPIPLRLKLELPDDLIADAPLEIGGQVSSAQPLTLTVPVRAVKPIKATIQARIDGCDPALSATAEVNIQAAPPSVRRQSDVTLRARLVSAPAQGYVILSDRLPQNATYVPGSSRSVRDPKLAGNAQPVDGQFAPNAAQIGDPLNDPFVSGDRLYWVVPAAGRADYAITYRLAHTGSLEMPREGVAVILVLPQSRTAGEPRDLANIRLDPNSPLGKLVGQGDLLLLQGDRSALETLNKALPVGANPQPAQTVRVGGPATRIRVTALRLTTEPADRPEVLIEAFDANGLAANDPFVTLEIDPEPATPDADPAVFGYQVRLENGVGRVALRALGVDALTDLPTTVSIEARITNTNGTISSSQRFGQNDFLFQPTPDQPNLTAPARPFVVLGAAGVQINLGSPNFSAEGALKGFARGTVFGDYLLTLAVNWQVDYDPSAATPFSFSGDLRPRANPFERFPLLGDSSSNSSDARSSDGFYVRLERGPSYAMYGQIAPNFTGLLTGYSPNLNGAQVLARGDGYSLNAFAALVPNANLSNLDLNDPARRYGFRGDGTDLYVLDDAPVTTSSERVVIVTRDPLNTDLKLSERALTRGQDYAIDYVSGVIRLFAPLLAFDLNGNPLFLEVQYASDASTAPRELRFGVQGSLGSNDGMNLTATAAQYRAGTNPLYLFGIGASYRIAGFQLALESSFSGQPGQGGGLGLAGTLNYDTTNFQAQVRYQELAPGYVDPNSITPTSGRSLSFGATYRPSSFSVSLSGTHAQNFTTGAVDDAIGLEGRNDFGGFSAALGLFGKFGFQGGAAVIAPDRGLWATAGVELPLGAFRFGVTQFVPLTAFTYGSTLLSADYAITPAFGLRLSDRLTYASNGLQQELSLGARGSFTNAEILRTLLGNTPETPDTFGTTNIAASYDLTSTDGSAGRARIGLDTKIPLGDDWSAQLGAEALFSPSPSDPYGSLSLGLAYGTRTTKAGAQAQYSFGSAGVKQVYTLALLAQLSPEFVVSPSLEYAVLPTFQTLQNGVSVRDGGRFSLAASWRADDVSLLTNNTGRFGFYAPNGDTIEGEAQLGYTANERLFLRGGIAYRADANPFAVQFGAGARYFLTDRFGLGANAAYYLQPVAGTSNIAFGLEASYRVLDGVTLAAGYNFLGFGGGIGSFSTGSGFYLRLDWSFDERSLGFGR